MLVTLDFQKYTSKPANWGAITNRMKLAGGTEIDAAGFCQHVKQGKTWCGGVFDGRGGGWGEFVSQQLFALDFDNEGVGGLLEPLEALDRCEALGLAPICLYFTFSATVEPWHPRYRIVFDTEPVRDQKAAEGIVQTLLASFPEADQKCKNANRIFAGSNGEVWECWRVRP